MKYLMGKDKYEKTGIGFMEGNLEMCLRGRILAFGNEGRKEITSLQVNWPFYVGLAAPAHSYYS